jgi:acyl-coenzyme A synthetase/AMP-(fatty) acid ligase
MPEIYACYVYGVPNERKGQVFRVAAVIRHGKDAISEEEAKRLIFARIRAALPPAYQPDKVIIMKKLPRTGVGKIDIRWFEEHPDPEAEGLDR